MSSNIHNWTQHIHIHILLQIEKVREENMAMTFKTKCQQLNIVHQTNTTKRYTRVNKEIGVNIRAKWQARIA